MYSEDDSGPEADAVYRMEDVNNALSLVGRSAFFVPESVIIQRLFMSDNADNRLIFMQEKSNMQMNVRLFSFMLTAQQLSMESVKSVYAYFRKRCRGAKEKKERNAYILHPFIGRAELPFCL